MDQGSNKNHSPAYNFTPTVTKFCVMWEGLSLPHDTKFGNCRCKIEDSRSFHSWSLIHGLRWSGLIKVGPGSRFKIKILSYQYTNSDYKDLMSMLPLWCKTVFILKWSFFIMMTSSNGNIFRVTGPLCGEFIGLRWIPRKGRWRGAWVFSLICA